MEAIKSILRFLLTKTAPNVIPNIGRIKQLNLIWNYNDKSKKDSSLKIADITCTECKLKILDDQVKNCLNKRSEFFSHCRHQNKFRITSSCVKYCRYDKKTINFTQNVTSVIIGLRNVNKYLHKTLTAWKVSKYGVFSGSYFPVFSPCLSTWKFNFVSLSYVMQCSVA